MTEIACKSPEKCAFSYSDTRPWETSLKLYTEDFKEIDTNIYFSTLTCYGCSKAWRVRTHLNHTTYEEINYGSQKEFI